MNIFTNNIKEQNMFKEILNTINNDQNLKISFKDIMDSEKAYYIYSLTKTGNKNSVVVCSNVLSANKMMQDLKFFSDIEIIYYPAKQIVYYDVEAESKEIQNDRMYALSKINEKSKKIIVTTIDALQLPLPEEISDDAQTFEVKLDQEINFTKLAQRLGKMRI